MSDQPKQHLGHWLGPAPTSEEMGLFFKPKPEYYDEPIAGGPKRWRQLDGTFKEDEQNELTTTDNVSGVTQEIQADQESGSDCAGTGKQEGAKTAQG